MKTIVLALFQLALVSGAVFANGGHWRYVEVELHLSTQTISGYSRYYGPSNDSELPSDKISDAMRRQTLIYLFPDLYVIDHPIAGTPITSGPPRKFKPEVIIEIVVSSGTKHIHDRDKGLTVVGLNGVKLLRRKPLYQCKELADTPHYWLSYNPKVGERELAGVCNLTKDRAVEGGLGWYAPQGEVEKALKLNNVFNIRYSMD